MRRQNGFRLDPRDLATSRVAPMLARTRPYERSKTRPPARDLAWRSRTELLPEGEKQQGEIDQEECNQVSWVFFFAIVSPFISVSALTATAATSAVTSTPKIPMRMASNRVSTVLGARSP